MDARPMPWLNPCRDPDPDDGQNHKVPYPNDEKAKELLKIISETADTSYIKAQKFKTEFLRDKFKASDAEYRWRGNTYDWLPQLKKKLGENVTDEHLQTLEIKRSLLDSYEHLQRLAVGIEQVKLSEKSSMQSRKYDTEFERTEEGLLVLLCEIRTAIRAYDLLGELPETDRSIMVYDHTNAKLVGSNTASLNTRNWTIYREYLNCLEYIVQVFDHLRKQLE